MSHAYLRSSDNRRRASDASFSSGCSSNDGGLDATSARPTYRTNTTHYSDNPAVEYIAEDGDVLISRYVDPAYRNQQPSAFAGAPYPNNDHGLDEPMDVNQPPYALQWMISDGRPDDHAGMMGSLEALPSTTPPQPVPQEPTTELSSYGAARTIETENAKKGKKKQNQSPVPFGIYHNSSYEPETTKLGAGMTFQEAHTYGSGSHFLPPLSNAPTGLYATGTVNQHNFPHHYPDHIDPSDFYESQGTTEVGDTDWEMVDGCCTHDYWEQCPYCSSQRFASPRY